ncbi:hypothetical protein F2P81_019559 [Scophthalmus maximus]|uniref:Protein kinase domain-containing protein n=1 Tax=Scophthalmus maximus TaxID=52904 RepID=A0A6A4SD00_SCOMX|nr:hypothetical protein F2P81_019559 [Scophthalmus maximus]
METGQSAQVADMGGEHSAGPSAVERDRGDVSSPSLPFKQRSLRVVYVLNDGLKSVMASSPESGALQCLQRACDAESALLTTVTFGRLDFGETSVLDSFYDADIAIVDMSDVCRQPSLFYHLGVRESFDMANNVILYHDTDPDTAQSLKASSGNYYFIPYIVTPSHEYMCCESDAQRRAMSPFTPVSATNVQRLLCLFPPHLIRLSCRRAVVSRSASYKDTLLNDIRKAREKYQGEELAKELSRIKLRIDNTEVLTQDIVMNLLFSYRDIQDYDAMVKLVQTLEMLPTCDLATQPMIQFHYAFALNRRNSPGDREQALTVMLQVLQSCEHPAPDMFCLCGRIYKDIFLDSDCKDMKNRDNAIQWYRKGFELQPTLYSGINLAVLLIVAGQQFESSIELRKIGVRLNSLLGRKGSLEKMNNYWDVGQFFTVSMLANDIPKATQAAEKLFKLKPPLWYLRSVVQNLQLIQRFKKQTVEHSPLRERLNFWMDIIVEATQRTTNRLRFPVLILEPTKVYQPSYVSINNEAEEKNVSIWHVSPAETLASNAFVLVGYLSFKSTSEQIVCKLKKKISLQKGIHEWNFTATSIKGISISKFDERCCFLYVHDNSDDFQIYFSTEEQCGRFCSMVKEMISDGTGNAVELEGEGDGDTLEYEYDTDETEDRVVLGRGTYGVVYAGRDLSNQVRIAIKEIPERDSRYSQPLHEEIALHKYLKHRNIVQYLGSVSENGYIKIFMEQVPGGSLSALLRSKWGPLKEATIIFYTRQILEGLRYLHENQIVHRDIKGDNVLVNTYSGVLKISDFGTSKRLAGVNPCTETFTDYIHNVSLPVQLQCEATGSSSSEHGSVSPDCDSKHDGSEELQLSVEHIKQIICILRDFIHSPERRVMAATISKLKLDLDFDSTYINQIQLVLRNHHIKPHWMFAMDNIIRRAVQAAITILIPELQTHFGPASECEGAEKEDEVDEEEAEFGPVLAPHAAAAADDSGPALTSSAHSHEHQRSHQQLGAQLGRLKHETNRLLEELLQKEREYQQVLKTTLQQRAHELDLVRVRLRPPGKHVSPPSIFQIPADHEPDKQLMDWLKEQGADADTIDKVDESAPAVVHIRPQLRRRIEKGGVLCRIWRAIQRHRERERLTSDGQSEDDA